VSEAVSEPRSGPEMSEPKVEFRRFHHVTVGVRDQRLELRRRQRWLTAAVADWSQGLGWEASSVTPDHAVFALYDAYVELVGLDDQHQAAGVLAVAVVVDDVEAVVARVEAAGGSVGPRPGGAVGTPPGGAARIDPASLTGVGLELRPDDSGVAITPGHPYRRIHHVVVAVRDDAAAKQTWTKLFGAWAPQASTDGEVTHHRPVGRAWFGLTSAGTDAGALSNFLARRGEGVYALGLVVDDQPGTIAALRHRGVRLIGGPSSAQTFIHPASTHGLLLEVMAERRPSPSIG
jgi:catechol 2,3-dioxygenase-like lactoylglutathione lyase family enzyme